MAIADAHLQELASRTAPDRLRTESAARERFQVDGLTPAAVVEPADAKELAEIVGWARGRRAALLPVSSGSYLPIGNPPAGVDVAVSLARLNRILHYDPGDLTLSVESGVPLGQVQTLLGENQQFLPADPPYSECAAVGGLVAVNASGPWRYAYGTWRDYVLGVKFVSGEGTLVKTGGRVVKNVAGYDLSKLLIGSLGTLGIFTEINFKVFPQPVGTATFAAGFNDLDSALRLRSSTVHSVLQPKAIELIDTGAARLLGYEPLAKAPWSLLVVAAGGETVLERYQAELTSRSRDAGSTASIPIRGREEQDLWSKLRNLVAHARERCPATTVIKAALPLTQLGPFLRQAVEVSERYHLPRVVTAHAGTGVGTIYVLPEAGPAEAARAIAQAATEMIHAGNNLGGRVTLTWCPTEVKRDVNVWGPLRDDFFLMQKLKAQFDPDRILNPGRFLGGI